MSTRVLITLAIAIGFAFACGPNGPPLDAGCPVCEIPDANVNQ